MSNNLKGQLTKTYSIKDLDCKDSDVIVAASLHTSDIINEIIKDGLLVDREIALEIIKRFNNKAAEKLLLGYGENTGVVTMSSEIKGSIYKGKWNPDTNGITVAFKPGVELLQEINNTKEEIMENEVVNNEITDTNQINLSVNNASVDGQTVRISDRYLHIDNDVPACGIAFRRWLCKA
ncbi:MAG TPA: DNA-binding domain-containing protein [Paludibacter sp.]|nr:DNA-binding domain-containing protein [Paludibacter sp.]